MAIERKTVNQAVSGAALSESDRQLLADIASTIRGLSIDAIEAAGCGHPGLPLGCAEIGAYLYAKVLKHNPKNPDWINRDRFILSAGHGSMLAYSLLHLAGFDLSLNEIKNFRQMGSKTPGHPEYGITAGVETTTGPLGQGLATATGIALGNKMLSSQLGDVANEVLDSKVYVLAGDGDLMEGVTSEAGSLAGHLGLDNLVVIYDSNDICLDGPTDECFTENTRQRYESYGWFVTEINGHDFDQIQDALSAVNQVSDRPSLVIAKTQIGFGSPNYAGTSDVHGKALGSDEAVATKQALGIPVEPLFYVPEQVTQYFESLCQDQAELERDWQANLDKRRQSDSAFSDMWDTLIERRLPADLKDTLKSVESKANGATRIASNSVLQALHDALPSLVGGSADLSCSDNTMMKQGGVVNRHQFAARNIKYGVREFAMGAMASGIALQGMLRPYCGTFLTFSDYMRNAIRLASLMKLQVIYQFTHDSVFLGEDGPTHQPVEHVASLRAMPGLTVIRPADITEVKAAWYAALQHNGPTALILTRLNAPDLPEASFDDVLKGAYVIRKATSESIDYKLVASGSEVALALQVADALSERGKSVQVISFPSFELFEQQSAAYQAEVLDSPAGQTWVIEAQTSFGWHKYVGRDAKFVTVETFGESAPSPDIARHFGFTPEQILEKMGER